MAMKDVVLTLKADQVAVASVQLFPQIDGSAVMVVAGVTKDSTAQLVTLKEAKISVPASTKAIDALVDRALSELRKANGME